jgi:hypothetical protein
MLATRMFFWWTPAGAGTVTGTSAVVVPLPTTRAIGNSYTLVPVVPDFEEEPLGKLERLVLRTAQLTQCAKMR